MPLESGLPTHTHKAHLVEGWFVHRPMPPRPLRPLVHWGLTGRWRVVVAVLVVVAMMNLLGMVRRTQEGSVGMAAGRALLSDGLQSTSHPQPLQQHASLSGQGFPGPGVNFSQVHRSRRNHVHWGPGPVNASTAACAPQALEPGIDCR